MHRLVQVSFADLDIGELFQFRCGADVSALLMEKSGEYAYRFIEEPNLYYDMSGRLCEKVYRRVA